MKKELLKLACTSFLVMMCMSVNAQEKETSGNCGDSEAGQEATDAVTWEYDNGTLTFTGTGAIKTYSTDMPTAYPWYAYNEDIQTVIINEGITNIPAWAFAMYENLMSIRIPSTMKTIGWSALEETNLWNVWLPEGLEKIEGYAFMMTPFLAVSIPSTVTEIGECAFGYCEGLVSVGCYAAAPPALGNDAFGYCENIETVYVQSASVADYQSAEGWSDFGDMIQSPAGNCGPDPDNGEEGEVTDATWAFDMATRTLTIQGTKMGGNRPWESAGMGGSGGGFNPDNNVGYPCGIEHVIVGEGITEIPRSAFYMEVGIKSVILPSTLTGIGQDAFGECFNIETITCNATTPPTLADDGLENWVFYGECDWDENIPLLIEPLTAIKVPAASVAAYKEALGWSTYADVIQMPSTTVGDYQWATFYDGTTNYIAGDNTTVYIAWLDGTTLTLLGVVDKVIPAGNAVILRSEGAPELTATPAAGTDLVDNDLQGNDTPVVQDESYAYYALAYIGGKLAFCQVATDVVIPAGKAYLKVPSAGAPARWFFEYADSDTATKIAGVNKAQNETGAIYTLQGQRISSPTKSGVYIVGGKKVFIR